MFLKMYIALSNYDVESLRGSIFVHTVFNKNERVRGGLKIEPLENPRISAPKEHVHTSYVQHNMPTYHIAYVQPLSVLLGLLSSVLCRIRTRRQLVEKLERVRT